ncbi:MAG: PadR family transcriptional regulator [Clostridiaceae bacterium]
MEVTQMLKGVLEGCVLQIISCKETYGYEIVQELKKSGFQDITEGTIYPMLLRLEKKDIIAADLRLSEIGPQRKYYRLTQTGKAYLDAFRGTWSQMKEIVDKVLGGSK